jgi:hypothetical protein
MTIWSCEPGAKLHACRHAASPQDGVPHGTTMGLVAVRKCSMICLCPEALCSIEQLVSDRLLCTHSNKTSLVFRPWQQHKGRLSL